MARAQLTLKHVTPFLRIASFAMLLLPVPLLKAGCLPGWLVDWLTSPSDDGDDDGNGLDSIKQVVCLFVVFLLPCCCC